MENITITTIPPQCQGQIVEISYGWVEGELYRCRFDRADRRESWYVCIDDEAAVLVEDPPRDEPAIPEDAWIPCARPRGMQRYGG